MKKKKGTAVCMAIFMAAAMAGCGSDGGTESLTPTPTPIPTVEPSSSPTVTPTPTLTPTPTEAPAATPYASYADMMSSWRDYLADGSSENAVTGEDFCGCYELENVFRNGTEAEATFQLHDLDGDGTDELLLGVLIDGTNGFHGVYSWNTAKEAVIPLTPTHLVGMDYIRDGSILARTGKGSASFTFYAYTGGSSMNVTDSYDYAYYNGSSERAWAHYSGDQHENYEAVSEDALDAACRERGGTDNTCYAITDERISSVRRGTFDPDAEDAITPAADTGAADTADTDTGNTDTGEAENTGSNDLTVAQIAALLDLSGYELESAYGAYETEIDGDWATSPGLELALSGYTLKGQPGILYFAYDGTDMNRDDILSGTPTFAFFHFNNTGDMSSLFTDADMAAAENAGRSAYLGDWDGRGHFEVS